MIKASLLTLAVLSLLLTFWRWLAALWFPIIKPAAPVGPLRPFTVLKPLKGCDAETRACLRSWLAQDYPAPLQFLFGVASEEDLACNLVRELLAEFPGLDAQLVVCNLSLGANAKVSTLRQLEPLIQHPLVIMSDADTCIPPGFLASVAPLFNDPRASLVNCLYRLANPATLAMQWEAVAVNADFWTQVLQARSIGKADFALGAVMALPHSVLQEIGGFAPLSDFLADDYHLGQQLFERGKNILFANTIVDCREAPMNWAQVWAHQVRWARTIRVCQPVSFFFSILDNATVWPLLLLAVAPAAAALGLCASFLAFRIATALHQQARFTGSNSALSYWWMVPCKDLIQVGVWMAAFGGDHVLWRNRRYRVLPGGKLAEA